MVAARPIQLIATDVDGTLFNSRHEVPPSAAQAVRRATAAGVPIVICTGKMPGPWSERMLPALGLRNYAVYNNGGLIVDGAGKTMYEAALDADVVLEVLEAIEALGGRTTAVAYSVQGRDHKYQLFSNESADENLAVRWIAGAGEHPPVPVGSLRRFVQESQGLAVNKLWITTRYAPEEGLIEPGSNNWVEWEALSAAMTASVAGRAEILLQDRHTLPGLRGNSTIELMPLGQNKAAALEKVLKNLELPPEAMMCLGDGLNDLEMLALAGTSVAMGNAVDKVKEVAEYTTGRTNDEGGWAEALAHFGVLGDVESSCKL